MSQIDSLSLTLSAVCSADCVFCPRPHARKHEPPFMPLDLVGKILDESAVYDIVSIDVGENGDSFLNPQALEILRLIRSKSRAMVRMFTNFRSFKPDLIDAVLQEGLLDKVITNIDGATPEAYRAVKGLELDRVEPNIHHFLARKEALRSPTEFRIQALTLHHYVDTVRRVLDRDPVHVPDHLVDSIDDFDQIVERWRSHGVVPERSVVTLWVESQNPVRERTSVRQIARGIQRRVFPKPCRMFDKIERGLFIAPSGQVYLCCADFEFEITLGNLRQQTVREVVESGRRRDILKALARREFHKIGGPCKNPEMCRIYL